MQAVGGGIEARIERERLGAHHLRELGLTCWTRPRQVSSSTKDILSRSI